VTDVPLVARTSVLRTLLDRVVNELSFTQPWSVRCLHRLELLLVVLLVRELSRPHKPRTLLLFFLRLPMQMRLLRDSQLSCLDLMASIPDLPQWRKSQPSLFRLHRLLLPHR
jgi:hypothetical protein